MTGSTDPGRDHFARHIDAVTSGDETRLREAWEADGVVEFPYAVNVGTPTRLDGIDEIAAYFAGVDSVFGDFAMTDVRSWPLEAGHWLVEAHGSSTLRASGRPYEQDYVVRFRTSPRGRLRWWREYWDPTRM